MLQRKLNNNLLIKGMYEKIKELLSLRNFIGKNCKVFLFI